MTKQDIALGTALGARSTFDGLNILRGVAAIGVMLYHASRPLGDVLPSGYLAVDIFFLMSGYVIAHAYDSRFESGMGLTEFTRLRVRRFYGLYLLGLVAGAVAVAGLFLFQWPAFPMWQPMLAFGLALLFLPMLPSTYSGTFLYPLNVPSWSLAVELVINIAYAAFWRHLTDRLLALVCFTSLAILVIATVYGSGQGGHDWSYIGLGYARAAFAFPLGVLLYRRAIRLPASIPATLAPVFLIAALMIAPAGWKKGYDLLFVAVISPAIVLIAVGRVAVKWRKLCNYLGRTSYPLYTLHVPAIITAVGAAQLLGIPEQWVVSVALSTLLAGCWYLDLVDERYRRKRVERASVAPVKV